MLTKYVNERETKNDFLLGIQFQEEKAQRQDILGILLPEFIREDVILGKTNFSRDQEEASILFCDVSEFDKIMDAEDYKIVSLLDNLFREFDELTFSYGLQKIETVGKTYMAAGGLKAVERNLSKKITRTNHYIRMLMMS
jgi:class 3 adenylate cyclase